MTQVGDRVRLISTNDPYTRLRPGIQGTVVFIDDVGTVHVKWDDGSRLGMVEGEDRFAIVPAFIPSRVYYYGVQAGLIALRCGRHADEATKDEGLAREDWTDAGPGETCETCGWVSR